MGDLRRCVDCKDKINTKYWQRHRGPTMQSNEQKLDVDSVAKIGVALGEGKTDFELCMGYEDWLYEGCCYKYSGRNSGVAGRHKRNKWRN